MIFQETFILENVSIYLQIVNDYLLQYKAYIILVCLNYWYYKVL